jgi:hypothetical protein
MWFRSTKRQRIPPCETFWSTSCVPSASPRSRMADELSPSSRTTGASSHLSGGLAVRVTDHLIRSHVAETIGILTPCPLRPHAC